MAMLLSIVSDSPPGCMMANWQRNGCWEMEEVQPRFSNCNMVLISTLLPHLLAVKPIPTYPLLNQQNLKRLANILLVYFTYNMF